MLSTRIRDATMKKSTAFFLLAASVLPGGRLAGYEIVPIERIDGDSAVSLSSDGRVVVGTAFDTVQWPIRWTRDGGPAELGPFLDYDAAGAIDVSGDGSVVVGYAIPAPYAGYRWTADEGFVSLGSLPGGPIPWGSQARAVSSDGRTVVGYDFANRPFRWTRDAGMLPLGIPPEETSAQAIDVSEDGSVIAVRGVSGRPFLWTAQSGYQSLGPPPSGWNSAYPVALSDDGSVLIGTGGVGTEGSTLGRPFRWTLGEGLQALPTLHGGEYFRLSMTADATVILGNERFNEAWTPVVWTENQGARRLHDILAQDHGFLESDLFFDFTRAISADQRVLVARSGTNRSNYKLWALYLDKPLITPVPEPPALMLAMTALAAATVRRIKPRLVRSARHGGC